MEWVGGVLGGGCGLELSIVFLVACEREVVNWLGMKSDGMED